MRRVQRLAAETDRIPLSTREPTKNETPRVETEWPNCAPGRMALPTVNRERQTGSYSQSRTTRRLASLAVRALIEEAELTPKPALVDDRGGGAQEDLSVFLMRLSARCLAPFFELIALISLEQIPTQTLREELGTIGRWAEHFMLRCTGANKYPSGIDLGSWPVAFRCCDGCGFSRGNRGNCKTTCLLA